MPVSNFPLHSASVPFTYLLLLFDAASYPSRFCFTISCMVEFFYGIRRKSCILCFYNPARRVTFTKTDVEFKYGRICFPFFSNYSQSRRCSISILLCLPSVIVAFLSLSSCLCSSSIRSLHSTIVLPYQSQSRYQCNQCKSS